MSKPTTLWCCSCAEYVQPRLTTGAEVYPHRADLKELPFWRCDGCKNWVGCHHKTKNPTRPLGNIPSPELKTARGHIHALIDPLWKGGKITRSKLYAKMSKMLGWHYHTASLRTLDEARQAYRVGLQIRDEISGALDVIDDHDDGARLVRGERR